MSTEAPPRKQWIQNPALDTIFYSFGWIAALIPLVYFKQDILRAIILGGTIGGIKRHPELLYPMLTIVVVLVLNYVHRHYTFALVYGEREEFEKRKKLYISLPFISAAVTLAFILTGHFVIILTISVMWTIYHVVSQKYGITRIYSRKAGYGQWWMEKGILYSWFVYLVFAIVERSELTLSRYTAGRELLGYIGGYLHIFTTISYFCLAAAIVFTLIYAHNEYKFRARFSWAKNLYVFSILLIYATFFYDFIIGYLVFGFSHALEYVVFVNTFVSSKYKQKKYTSALAAASKKLWLYSSLFSAGVVVFCLVGMNLDRNVFEMYIVGSSFLHFIYDGWIWKVSKPEVGTPFKIKYASV
ncbi:MAG: hypothetical protein V3U74_00470 [Thermodesulfobacteriota bacterium]